MTLKEKIINIFSMCLIKNFTQDIVKLFKGKPQIKKGIYRSLTKDLHPECIGMPINQEKEREAAITNK